MISAFSIAAFSTSAHAAIISEVESNDNGPGNTAPGTNAQDVTAFSDVATTLANPNIFPNAANDSSALPFASVTINGAISPDGIDIDFYSFSGLAGAQMYFDVDNDGLTDRLQDSALSLFDANGTLPAFGDDDNDDPGSPGARLPPLDSFIGVYTLPSTQTYSLAVTIANRLPNELGATSSTDLTRPDGGRGGFGVNGASAGNDSFDQRDVSTFGNYRLHLSSLALPTNPAPVPEPGTMALMGVGLANLVGAAKRRRKSV